MTISISGQREQIVLSLVRAGKFASADEMIDEMLRLVGRLYQEPGEADDGDRSRQQLENLRLLARKLDAMPTVAVADGLTNRDHDQILHGK